MEDLVEELVNLLLGTADHRFVAIPPATDGRPGAIRTRAIGAGAVGPGAFCAVAGGTAGPVGGLGQQVAVRGVRLRVAGLLDVPGVLFGSGLL
ncbi:hypothetical protein, partial [Dietzia sp. CW19]|uniref:hypothetical protein n=1 Tax=Dietzia sp. CW19 TaxID=1630634 RepID=UPI0019D5010A